MWGVSIFAVLLFNGVYGCKWVCIDNKNHIKREYIDSSKFKLELQENEIELSDELTPSRKRHFTKNEAYDILPEVSMKMPQFDVEPVKGKTKKRKADINCNPSQFRTTMNEMTKKTKCKPKDTIISINFKGGKVVPDKITAKKCSGVCGKNGRTCLTQETKNTTLTVSIRDSSNRFQCSNVVVSEDTKCKCACDKSPVECSPNQVLDKTHCKCKCTDIKEQQSCLDRITKNSHKYVWNPVTCSCDCKVEKICTTGTDWDRNECKCIRSDRKKLK